MYMDARDGIRIISMIRILFDYPDVITINTSGPNKLYVSTQKSYDVDVDIFLFFFYLDYDQRDANRYIYIIYNALIGIYDV